MDGWMSGHLGDLERLDLASVSDVGTSTQVNEGTTPGRYVIIYISMIN